MKRTHIRVDVTDLTPRHIEALERFIAKFKSGAALHGDLIKGKDWTKDMLDETIDDCFYRIFQLLDILEKSL